MNTLIIDFETYYDKEYSLSKMTTEEYVRDPRFEVIGVAVKLNNEETEWASGTREQLKRWLSRFPWDSSLVIAHNMLFDGAILSWYFGITAKVWGCTLCMGRALHGVEVGGSLKALAERYDVGVKGDEVVRAIGMRRGDFDDEELSRYGDYCVNDVDLTYRLFYRMMTKFPKTELKLIHTTLQMFVEPVLELDLLLLEQHLDDIITTKEKLLSDAGVTKDILMSNQKFADLLATFGVRAPTKISPTTGKETLALAKNDEEFKALADYPDIRVQTLVAARLGTKSTLEETRTQRFIEIAKRGTLPIPIRYYAAHTGRWGGDDKINMQNLPSRGANANKLKKAILAPDGYVIVDADSAQIEARVLAWLAQQDDLVAAFEKGEDVYRIMASAIYGKDVADITKEERFVGKTTILGCIGSGTQVLCDSGWKPIEHVSIEDKLWDGEEWVCHRGLLNKGIKQTLNLCGAWLTPDHKVWSGTQWLEAQSVVADENILSQALGIGAANLPSQAMYVAQGSESKHSLYDVTATKPNTQLKIITSKILEALAAPFVRRKLQAQNDIGVTLKSCLTTHTARGYLTGCLLPLPVATTPTQKDMLTMGVGGSPSTMSGETIGHRFLSTFKHLMGGKILTTKLTELTTTKGMSRGTYDSQPVAKTCSTNEKSKNSSKKLMTYDLAYAGPRNRFTILTEAGPVIVHNCGYGMGAVKFQAQLKAFGTEVDIDEARRIIDIYRKTNQSISFLWRQANDALVYLSRGESMQLGRPGVVELVPEETAVRLPSGLLMRYDELGFVTDDEGRYQFSYKTRRGRTKIYGGKVVENLCQAIARCIIGEQMLKIAKRYKVVLTVHDAIACIVPEEEAQEGVAFVEQCMRWTPDWASGLPINCESGVAKSYGYC
jgi:hypothetical protein